MKTTTLESKSWLNAASLHWEHQLLPYCFRHFRLQNPSKSFLNTLTGKMRQAYIYSSGAKSSLQGKELPNSGICLRSASKPARLHPGEGTVTPGHGTGRGHGEEEQESSADDLKNSVNSHNQLVIFMIKAIFGMSWVTWTLPQQEHNVAGNKCAG